ncbi:MAG TPA: response regulator transcription factor [Anaerolineae bacterium]|nr:response regulator transcription factor [Anaerolineae bacterium]
MLPLRVLVADDHRLFRQGLIGLMNTRKDLVEVVGEAASGREAVLLAQRLQPDVVLMDIHMPDGDGLQATARIRQLSSQTSVVMLTASELDEHLYEAVRLGAAGYLLKSLDASELFDLLDGVSRGEAAMTRAMAARVLKSVAGHATHVDGGREPLTEREIDVLRLVAQGMSNPEIAERLNITVNTVKVHLRNILDKLQVENRTQAAAYAVQSGLVTSLLPDPA